MSEVKVNSAQQALLELGVGIGDVASIFAHGRRNGNWWTAVSNDKALLTLLNGTESSVVQRRGILDLVDFNKAWRSHLWLLSNGRPLKIWEPDAKKVLKNPNDLLHVSPDQETANGIFYAVLKALFDLGPVGEDVLRAHYGSHISGWRSTARVRGVSHYAEQNKLVLIQNGVVLNGHMNCAPTHLTQFLVWMLGTTKPSFETYSADIGGIAKVLRNLGLNIGFGEPNGAACCLVVYQEPRLRDGVARLGNSAKLIQRSRSVTVSLLVPWETIKGFPVDFGAQNLCQAAWKIGQRVAKHVGLGVCKPTEPGKAIEYAFYDEGNTVTRTTLALSSIANNYSLAKNQQFLDGLCECHHHATGISFEDINNGIFKDISAPQMMDLRHVSAFCAFQAYLMGYYYEIFGRLVDTSTLKLQVVEGAWGFRTEFLHQYIRFVFLKEATSPPGNEPGVKIFSKHHVFSVLSLLFMGCLQDVPELITSRGRFLPPDCVGIVSKRCLLTNSLVGKCSSPRDIAGFTLVDADVSGLPQDCIGLVKSEKPKHTHSISHMNPWIASGAPHNNLKQKGPDKDVTFTIEPDWDHNPSSAVVCVRYNGRRITSISPIANDGLFCSSFVPPQARTPEPQDDQMPAQPGPHPDPLPPPEPGLHEAIELDLPGMMENKGMLPRPQKQIPVLVQALDRPRLRYTAAALYFNAPEEVITCRVASECVRRAQDAAALEGENGEVVIVAATTYDARDVPVTLRYPPVVGPKAIMDVYPIKGPSRY
ncbi:hypothetical protein B0H67DRAFT_483178 [Lasiosphaeris hirsuta]|uniref:Uncharacterized protein n=1 Tax=Lasiosphaeris hirsuta TaxID=260670 RepID=A0AA40AZJ1_9PEZI|nr:hypothetical protein B0H67DRAFT_483178 [Lasiosphaeris hirsuta]